MPPQAVVENTVGGVAGDGCGGHGRCPGGSRPSQQVLPLHIENLEKHRISPSPVPPLHVTNEYVRKQHQSKEKQHGREQYEEPFRRNNNNNHRSHRRRTRRPNRVTFSSTVDVHPVLHRRDMTLKEVRNSWYGIHERVQIKNVSNNTVYLMKTGVGSYLTHDDYFCPRGLEHQWDALAADSKEEAYKSHRIALAMQRLLRRSGSDSPQMIARAYRKYTLKSRRLAYQRGLDDQQEQHDGDL